jgi:hypothetical protein
MKAVTPPSAQWVMWWASHHDAGALHPAHAHPPSRSSSALRIAGVTVRTLRPTSRGWLSPSATIRTMPASQARRLIAASTQQIGARLATGNPSDFPMDEITVEHWPVRE